MLVTLDTGTLDEIENHGSVVLFVGNTDEGKRVSFAVDHRMAGDLLDHLITYEEVQIEVEGWQIWGRA